MAATKNNPVIWPQRFGSEAAARKAWRESGQRGGARFVRSGGDTVIVQGDVSPAMAQKMVSGLMGGGAPRGENPGERKTYESELSKSDMLMKEVERLHAQQQRKPSAVTKTKLDKAYAALEAQFPVVQSAKRAMYNAEEAERERARAGRTAPLFLTKNPGGVARQAGREAAQTFKGVPSDSLIGKWFSAWRSKTGGTKGASIPADRKEFSAGVREVSNPKAKKNALIERQIPGKGSEFYFTLSGKTFGPYKSVAERETARKAAMGLKQSAAEKFMAKYRIKANPGWSKMTAAQMKAEGRKAFEKHQDPDAQYAWNRFTKDHPEQAVQTHKGEALPSIKKLRTNIDAFYDGWKAAAKGGASNPFCKRKASSAKNGAGSGGTAANGAGGRKPAMSVTQGTRRIDIFQEGKKFAVPIWGEVKQSFDKLESAAKYARLKLAEVANQPAKFKTASKTVKKLLSRNPGRRNPEAAAADSYEMFHGLPSTQVFEYREKVHVHEHLWAAGTLVSMVIKGPRGGEVTLRGPDPDKVDFSQVVMVCFTEVKDRKNDMRSQMYFRGGDQSIPVDQVVEAFGLTDDDICENMEIGRIKRLTYRTFKNFEEGGEVPIDFYHNHGKEDAGGVLPLLCYRPLEESMFVVGGRYKIAPKDRVLKASPGVVG